MCRGPCTRRELTLGPARHLDRYAGPPAFVALANGAPISRTARPTILPPLQKQKQAYPTSRLCAAPCRRPAVRRRSPPRRRWAGRSSPNRWKRGASGDGGQPGGSAGRHRRSDRRRRRGRRGSTCVRLRAPARHDLGANADRVRAFLAGPAVSVVVRPVRADERAAFPSAPPAAFVAGRLCRSPASGRDRRRAGDAGIAPGRSAPTPSG